MCNKAQPASLDAGSPGSNVPTPPIREAVRAASRMGSAAGATALLGTDYREYGGPEPAEGPRRTASAPVDLRPGRGVPYPAPPSSAPQKGQ